MLNSRFGYSMKKKLFKGLNIDCVQYSNIIQITYYSYSYSGTILNPNIIRIRIRPNIFARMLFVFVFAHSEKTNIIRINHRSRWVIPLRSSINVILDIWSNEKNFCWAPQPKNSWTDYWVYIYHTVRYIYKEVNWSPH